MTTRGTLCFQQNSRRIVSRSHYSHTHGASISERSVAQQAYRYKALSQNHTTARRRMARDSMLRLPRATSREEESALYDDGYEEDDGAVKSQLQTLMYPDKSELPNDFEMPIWDHLEELRERVMAGALAAGIAVLTCFAFSKDLVVFLEAPVAEQGVRFLQLSPGEFFFTTLKVGGYSGILLSAPTVLYEIIAYIVPGLTKSERRFLAPVVFGSSILFYIGLAFSYEILTPAALTFFVSYADGAVESLWSIDQYFEFVLTLMLSTGLSFQIPVIQVMLGQLGIVSSQAMLSQWRFVVVGATIIAAVLTPSTDPFTQTLLAAPLIGLYMGGAGVVSLIENSRDKDQYA